MLELEVPCDVRNSAMLTAVARIAITFYPKPMGVSPVIQLPVLSFDSCFLMCCVIERLLKFYAQQAGRVGRSVYGLPVARFM